jgi:hypothetical protein
MIAVMGCGFTQVKGPDDRLPAHVRPECTTSDAPLKIDAAVGASGVFLALIGAALYKAEPSNTEVLDAMIIGGVVVAVAMLASSGIGYSRVKRCRRAVDAYDRQVGVPPPQQDLRPAPL